jgi:large subunit ribosomal protein L4
MAKPSAPVLGGTKKVTLDEQAFGARFNGALVHESVRAELAARRQGSASTYTFKVNRKERRAALRSALSVHAERGSLAILDPAGFDEPATKKAAELLAGWSDGGSVLVVLAEEQARVALSFRNLARVSVLPADGVGVADVIGAGRLLVSQEALDQLTARAKGAKQAAEEEDA